MKTLRTSILLAVLAMLGACSHKKELSKPSSYKEIISFYSSHNLSIKSPILIQFVDSLDAKKIKKIPKSLFCISPKVDGDLIWKDNQTLQFTPRSSLKSNQTYQVSLQLSVLFPKIADSLETFTFDLNTKAQNFSIGNSFLHLKSEELYSLSCHIQSNDFVALEDLKRIVSAKLESQYLKIKWNEVSDKQITTSYYFTIDSIARAVDPQTLQLHLDASSIGFKIKKETEIVIPALGDFNLVEAEFYQDKSQEIKLIFSDFIDENQSIAGLIHVNKGKYEISIHDNTALLSFLDYVEGDLEITVEKGLLNAKKYKHQNQEVRTIHVPSLPPAVRLKDRKTILPYAKILPFSFEAVNLNAVDVRITKISQRNILQFLQRNELNESDYLHYVGEEIVTKKINLKQNRITKLWNKQSIDLKPLIAKDPAALYHVEIGFRQSYTTCGCSPNQNIAEDPSTLGLRNAVKVTEKNFWELHDREIIYNWDEYENPCNHMFYKENYYYYNEQNKTLSTNILGSNLGLIAKKETDGDFLVALSSIQTTAPISNAKIELFNLQNKRISSATTDATGMVKIKNPKAPFLLVASSGVERAYLKLQDYDALSISNFEVGGTQTSESYNGLLYAERGVWRPGDSIFINLLLDDKYHNFPKDYPVGFEFTNPQGQIVERRTSTKSLNGHYTFWTKTDLDALTGNYLVKAFVGNRSFQKSIKVEAIRPNRLKLEMKIGEQETLFADSSFEVKLTSKWLHGAVGANLRHKIDVTFQDAYTTFNGYSDYQFKMPYREFKTKDFTFLDENSDEKGIVEKSMKIQDLDQAPGFLKAKFKVKVFEKGGRFSVDEETKILHPYPNYVGMKSYKSWINQVNEVVKFDLVNLNTKNQLTNDRLIVRLFKVDYNWWYELKDNFIYNGEMSQIPIKTDTIQTKNGKYTYQFIYKDYLQTGQYLIVAENSSGHKTGQSFELSNHDYYDREINTNEGTKKLNFSSNKASYEVGETVTLSIPTASSGRVLVSLENGREIIQTKWIEVNSKNTSYSFQTNEKMAPYVYASVIYTQPYAHKANDLPLRMYGVIPIAISSKNSHLEPLIQMKDELRPESNFSIQIKEKKNLPMTYTLAIVDEGLLDITHYKMPKVWDYFYEKPALEVKTWDVYDRVIEHEKLNVKNLLSIGGDGSETPPDGMKLNRFKPMVKFIGPFYCAAGETKTHQIQMPNYIGSVKVMVIAGHNGAYGENSKTVAVKKPLMVLGTLPRVLGPNETIQLPVDIFAMKDHIKNVVVSVKTNDLVDVLQDKNKTLDFPQTGDKQVFFQLKTKDKFGVARVEITAKSGKEISTYLVELNVRAPNANRIVSSYQVLPAGVNFQQTIRAFGYAGTNKITAELSSIPALNLQKRLEYLIQYPYGCVEQTTSSVFPQLYLNSLIKLEASEKRKIERNIQQGILRLQSFQTAEGGFSYWPREYQSHEWGTNYAGHFLLEAKKMGFEVDGVLMANWTKYQYQETSKFDAKNGNKLTQGYRLYLLAKAGKANIAAMNVLRVNSVKNDLSNWYLAAAYSLIGEESLAEDLVKIAPKTAINTSHLDNLTFASDLRNNAIILSMLAELGKKDLAANLTKTIALKLNSDEYLNTQTTAYCLLAMVNFVSANDNKTKLNFTIDLKGKSTVTSTKTIWKKSVSFEELQTLSIQNLSSSQLFLNLTQEGIPNEEDTINEALGLQMTVEYLDENNQKIDITKLPQGQDFVAQVKIKNPSNTYYRNLSLTQIFPSGWEINNERIMGSESYTNPATFEDVRDDRVNLFYDLGAGETKVFKVSLNASYVGQYFLPSIEAEAMYDHSIRARKQGQWIEIIR